MYIRAPRCFQFTFDFFPCTIHFFPVVSNDGVLFGMLNYRILVVWFFIMDMDYFIGVIFFLVIFFLVIMLCTLLYPAASNSLVIFSLGSCRISVSTKKGFDMIHSQFYNLNK